jgi:hypothetical protein
MNKRPIGIVSSWHCMCIIPPLRLPTTLAARPQKRADLWWCDNIPDFQRLFPAPLSTKVTSIRLAKRGISHGKDVGSKVVFKPSLG